MKRDYKSELSRNAAWTLGRAWHDFKSDERGVFFVFGMFVFLVMLAVAGFGVDIMRFEANRARLQSTLDRAILAAASLDQRKEPEDVVLDYFAKAGLSEYISIDDITSTTSLTSRQVSAEVRMDVQTTLLRISTLILPRPPSEQRPKIYSLSAPASGIAEESASRTEVSLVLDVSGSMSWNSSSGRSKIAELRDAATEFVNIMQCNPEDPDETVNCTVEPNMVSITMIPYDEQVVAGSLILDELTVSNEHSASNCLTFELDDFDSASIDPNVEYQRTGHFDPWRDRWDNPGTWTCKTNGWRHILPFENEAGDLRDQIDDLRGSGYTSIDLGMKWASAFLDPEFQPLIQTLVDNGDVDEAFDDRPFSYSEIGIKKVVVIMTDGVNTTQHYLHDAYRTGPSGVYFNTSYPGEHSIRRWRDFNLNLVEDDGEVDYFWTDHWHWHDHPQGADEPGVAVEYSFQELWTEVTWEWYEAWSWLNNPGSSFGNSTKNSRLETICDTVKENNVTVYSIGFEVTDASAAVMENCASSPAHFFDVEGSDIGEAFASIARQISALRLVN